MASGAAAAARMAAAVARSRRRLRPATAVALCAATLVAALGGGSGCWVIGRHAAQGGRRAPQLSGRRATKGAGPVLDDSDFDIEDDPKGGKKDSGKANTKELQSILDAADKFAIKKDKQKKKSSSLVSLEDELKGMAIEDEADLTGGLMKTARTGKVDVSVEGRLAKWLGETQELISNPTKLQLTYATIFFGSVALLFLAGVVTFFSGAIHFKGEGIDYDSAQRMMEDPFSQRYKIIKANREKAMTVKNIGDLYNDQPGAPNSMLRGMWGMEDSVPYEPLPGQPTNFMDALNQTPKDVLDRQSSGSLEVKKAMERYAEMQKQKAQEAYAEAKAEEVAQAGK